MNLKNIIVAASVALLSVTGIQQADAQHVVRRHHVTVRHSDRHHPVVRHHRTYRSRAYYGHGRRYNRSVNRRHRRTHSATVIVR